MAGPLAATGGEALWLAAATYVAQVHEPLSSQPAAMQLSVASADLYAAALAYATHEVVPERMIHGDPPIYSDAVLSRIHSELALATRREVAWSIGYGFVEAQSIWEHVLGASSDSDDRAALVWGGFSTFGWWGSKLLVSMAFLHEALV